MKTGWKRKGSLEVGHGMTYVVSCLDACTSYSRINLHVSLQSNGGVQTVRQLQLNLLDHHNMMEIWILKSFEIRM